MFTYAAPRISHVLSATGELEHRIAKRVVDTTLLASAVMEHGFKGAGRDAARRVNAMHSRYEIHPDDFVAVGCEEALGSLELAERYGWREVTEKEQEAVLLYYSHQARAFGSPKMLPATVPEMRAAFSKYLDSELRYEPQNERLTSVLLKWFGNLVPVPLRPLFRMLIVADLDPRIAHACGLRPASKGARWIAQKVLRRNGRQDPVPDGAPNGLEALVQKVYPNGWDVNLLGTHNIKHRSANNTAQV
jgi:uncharacterized protein (DUF2236 family)